MSVADGGLYLQSGVAAPVVVPADVVEDGEFGGFAGAPAVPVDELVLDAGEAVFAYGVVG
jgi:hypothetical protein